jgi:hypothetical protein
MTDKEFEKQKGRIQKLSEKWIKPLGLGWWTIKILYERTSIDRDTEDKNSETIMCVSPLPQYRTATITCFLLSIIDLDDIELEKSFIHELMHIFVSPMSSKNKHDQEEYVATDLANAFYWLERHLISKYEPKKGKTTNAKRRSDTKTV